MKLAESGTLQLLPQPEPIVPAAGHPFAQGLDFGARPLVCWAHRATPKEGATVALKAGDLPVLVTWQVGKGRVAVLAAPPYGQLPAGQTGYWDWPEWPKVMQRVVAWLGDGKGEKGL